MSRRLAVVFVSLLTLGAVGSVPVAAATVAVVDGTNTTGATTNETGATTAVETARGTTTDTTVAADAVIAQRVRLSLTPAEPGQIRVRYSYNLPSYLVEFRLQLSNRTTFQSAEGFERSDGRYVWDGTSDPTLTVTYAPNRTTRDTGLEAPMATPDGAQGFLFTDRGPWALVQVPRYEASWRYERGREPPRLVQRVRTDGPGVVGTDVAFLGAHTVHERAAHGQRLRLVVPAAATMGPSPSAVLNATAAASGALRVGDRDESVWLFAAPTGVDWAVRGLQTGPTDAWVRADAPLTTADNVWLHEYVHTRQSFTAADETAWLTEGSADYYAAALSLRAGLIEFEAFADALARGRATRVADTVLARPATWGRYGDYHVGALVAAELDRRLRDAGDSLDAVVSAANADDGTFTAADLEATLSSAGGDETAAAAARYTTTTDRPPVWNRSVHAATFGGVAAFETATTARVAGPYREGPLPSPVVTGETVAVDTRVRNTGDAAGNYRLVVSVDGSRVDTRNGTLAPGASTVVTVTRTFETAGDHTLVVGDERVTVTVRAPATPRVNRLSAPSRVAVGDAVPVNLTVTNPAAYPAVGDVTVAADGQTAATRRVTLAPGETRALSVTVPTTAGGEVQITAGDRTATVTVTTPTPTQTPSPTPGTEGDGATTRTPSPDAETDASGPGLGVAAGLVALAALALGLRLRDRE